jgi:hypothetical protein
VWQATYEELRGHGFTVVSIGLERDPEDAREWITAAALGRPLVVEAEAGAAYLGEAASTRAADLRTRVAPDFELPDLAGVRHRLSDERGKKVFLVFWASW